MSCQWWDEKLNDLIDGTLEAGDAEGVERHAAGCDDCGRSLEALRHLRRQAEALPREVEPRRDLWPEIRSRLDEQVVPHSKPAEERRGSRWLLGLAAAAILVIGVAAGLMLRPGPEMDADPSALLVTYQAEAEYLEITAHLLQILEERKEELSPETRAVVERNLTIIDTAIEEVRVALEEDPGDVGNGIRFTHLYGRKVALLRQAVAVPAKS